MNHQFTRHAQIRSQQRGIPLQVSEMLLAYGEEHFDGHGAVIRYFSRRCRQYLRGDLGAEAVKRLSTHLRAYLVQDARDGVVITVGLRHPNKRGYQH